VSGAERESDEKDKKAGRRKARKGVSVPEVKGMVAVLKTLYSKE
jgi:hypothetical protein